LTVIGRPREGNTFEVAGEFAVVDVSTTTHPQTYTAIDLADLSIINDGGGRWFAATGRHTVYAVRRNGDKLHRKILGLGADGGFGDHADGNGLDNRRFNLRPANFLQNNRNSRKRAGAHKFKGVYLRPETGAFRAGIKLKEKLTWLGQFDDEISAARAYDTAARIHFGEFARLNFPGEQ